MTSLYPQLVAGTAQTWSSSGQTHVLTATSLAAAAARQGDKSSTWIDATLGFPEYLEIALQLKFTSAPADQAEVELWLGFSNSATAGTNNPSSLTGSDAALSSPASVKTQLTYVFSLLASNSIGTGLQAQSPIRIPCVDIACIPAIVNSTAVAFSGTGTDFLLTITPWFRKIP